MEPVVKGVAEGLTDLRYLYVVLVPVVDNSPSTK